MYYILKNSDGLYWGVDNNYTKYPNAAKLYNYNDALKASKRRNLTMCKAKFIPGPNPFTHFITETN